MSIADQLLATGCAAHISAVQGEPILILSGPDAGKTFTALREIEADLTLDGSLGPDGRARRMMRFMGAPPTLNSQSRMQTEDGKVWKAVDDDEAAYQSTDFHVIEVTAKDT